jgi:hypothetical protein
MHETCINPAFHGSDCKHAAWALRYDDKNRVTA